MGIGRWLAAGLAPLALAAGAAADELASLTAAPLPMAIRDGRIAAVTVREVPFAPGSKALAQETAAVLTSLADTLATDCFLTAQAVGHARPGVPGDGDTLPAQDLAQARAELVQRALVAAGLPAEAIAAVSDYRFTVREPRVTLWIFELDRGADCAGKPLPRRAAPTPPKPAPSKATAEPEPPAASPALASTEIRFAAGSSFFPDGAGKELARLVSELPKDRAYRIQLFAGVDDTLVKPEDPAESARYNRWLAQRRLARVSEWLEQHAEIRDLTLTRALREEERTPKVVVRVLRADAGGG